MSSQLSPLGWLSRHLLLWVVVSHCGPSFSLRAPPSLPPILPRVPTAPAAQSSEQDHPPQDEHRATTAHPVGDLRAQTIAIVLEGDEASCRALEALLPTALVGARFTRILLPDSVQNLTGTVTRGPDGERTVVQGTLPRLLPMRANTPADQLLRVRVADGSASGQHARRFEVPADQLLQYATAYADFRQRLLATRAALQRVDGATYASEYQQVRAQYEAAGGRYSEEEDRNRREEADLFIGQFQRMSELVASAEQVPTPEQVQRQATREETQTTTQPAVTLDAVLTDLRAGETWWVGQIVGMGPDRPSAQRRALQLLLGELAPGAP